MLRGDRLGQHLVRHGDAARIAALLDHLHHLGELGGIGEHVRDAVNVLRDRRHHGGVDRHVALVLELHRQIDDVSDGQIGRDARRRGLDDTRKLVHRHRQHFVDDRLDELALVLGAGEVAVRISAAAREHQRGLAVKMLKAGFDDDMLDARIVDGAVRLRIVDKLVDLNVHTAHGIDQRDEVAEVHLGVMRDLHTAQLARLADDARGAIVGVGVVELRHAMAVDVDGRVAGNRHHGRLVLRSINADEDVGVRTRFRLGLALADVGTDQHHVERLVEIGGHQLLVNCGELILGFVSGVERAVDAVDVQSERGAASDQRHEHHGDDADRDLLTAAGLLLGGGVRVRGAAARIRTRPVGRLSSVAKRSGCPRDTNGHRKNSASNGPSRCGSRGIRERRGGSRPAPLNGGICSTARCEMP